MPKRTPIGWPPRVRRGYAPLSRLEYAETLDALHCAQAGLCALCGGVMDHGAMQRYSAMRSTIDHVIPKAMGGLDGMGNFVATHGGCNQRKADGRPNGCVLVWLLAVNARLSLEPSRW